MSGDFLYINNFKSIQGSEGAWYKIFKFLGKGGNGISYLVLCTSGKHQGCIFTLKILYRISQQDRVDKFIREVAFLERCNFPTILHQYDSGSWNERPFVVTDYMSLTLEDSLKKNELSLGNKLLFSLQLLSAIKYLQANNVVHRDIKPSNIFIKDNTAVLGDFGLIKDVRDVDGVNDSEDFKGYFAMPHSYRTPELIAYAKSEANICFESDVFQLGLVLCEMFTGKNPLMDSKDALSPIRLSPISRTKNQYINRATWIIQQMLKLDKMCRISVDQALMRFNKLFEDYSQAKEQLDGSTI